MLNLKHNPKTYSLNLFINSIKELISYKMSVKNELVCRTCLNRRETECVLIDDTTRMVLNVLLPNINLNLTEDPVICNECVDITRKLYDFKSAYVVPGCKPLSNTTAESEVKCEVKLESNVFTCQLCTCTQDLQNHIHMEDLRQSTTFLELVLKCTTLLGLNIKGNICTPCREHLEQFIRFLDKCLTIEDEILAYKVTTCTEHIRLTDLNALKNNLKPLETNLKQENLTDEGSGYHISHSTSLKSEEDLIIKDELITENISETSNKLTDNQDNCVVKTQKCLICPYETNRRTSLNSHMNTHSDSEKYKCPICPFETRWKNYLKKHKQNHENSQILKCESCNYETKDSALLRKHALTHKTASDVVMFKCKSCTYETKRLGSIKQHTLTHKAKTEVETFNCLVCPFTTKHKVYLKRHTLLHGDISVLETHKCPQCPFESRYKHVLKKHESTHGDGAKVDVFQCAHCSYETNKKYNLKAHILKHRSVAEVEMFKCEKCTYETRYKFQLKRHQLVHKTDSEVRWYGCTQCEFRTKWRSDYNKHVKTHN